MKPKFIILELNKFQLCCVPGCDNDAVVQFTAERKNETYYVTACGESEHQVQMQKVGKLIMGGASPRTLAKQKELNIEEVFFRPEEHTEKCKLVQWEEFQKNPEENLPKPAVKPLIVSERHPVITATDEWEWIVNIGKWMDIKGNTVAITALSPDEFVGAAIAILKANFDRVRKKRQWVSNLIPPATVYMYPEEAFVVGSDLAGDKLDEFLEVAEGRGLV